MVGGRTRTMLAWLALLVASTSVAALPPPGYESRVINPDLTGGRRIDVADGRILLVWGTDATILRSEDGRRWQHARTPGDADLLQLDADASGSVIVAVGAARTILRSTDGGRTWSLPRVPDIETDLRAVASAGERVWVAAGTHGHILRSVDDARTWTLVESKLDATLQALRFDAASGRLLIGGDDGLVGFSRDRGVSWQVTAISMPEPVTPISAFHRFGERLLATSARGRFLVSGDDADSWDLLQSSSPAFFTGAASDVANRVIVMTGHNGDVVRSADGGRTWDVGEVVLDGNKNFLGAIAHDARAGAFLVTGQAGVIARSADGIRWTSVARDLRGELRGLLNDRDGSAIVFGAGGLLASSTDSGVHWTTARGPLDHPVREVLAAPRGGALVATSRLGDILRSTDGGESWNLVTPDYPNPNTPPDLRGIVIAPSRDAMVAAGPPGAILRGTADGSEWHVAVWHDIEAERAFTWVMTDEPRNLLVAIEGRGAFRTSRDSGLTWETRDLGLAIDPGKWPLWQGSVLGKSGVLLVAGEGGRASRSLDGGASWQPLDTGTTANLYGSHADEATGHLFLAGAKGTLLRSEDAGKSWIRAESGSEDELRRFHRDPRSKNLLCFGANGSLLVSTDDGRRWKPVTTGTRGVLRKVIAEPRSAHLLVAGGEGTLLRSTDGGQRWERIDAHSRRHFTSIVADEMTGDVVLVGERIVRLVRQSPANSSNK